MLMYMVMLYINIEAHPVPTRFYPGSERALAATRGLGEMLPGVQMPR